MSTVIVIQMNAMHMLPKMFVQSVYYGIHMAGAI